MKLKIILPLILLFSIQACSVNAPVRKDFSFDAAQAEQNRMNTTRIDKIDRDRANQEKDKALNRDIRRMDAQTKLENAKPDTYVIDKSRSIHIH